MKMLAIFPLLLASLASSAIAGPLDGYHFLRAKSFEEKDGLPPKLELSFELPCNQEFVKVIRQEEEQSIAGKKTGKALILLGVLVKDFSLSSCAGRIDEKKVPAGNAYSGRAYKVELIQ